MAQVPATSYESIASGSVSEFTIPFPFLTRAEVFVSVNGAPVAFTWINDGLVQLSVTPAVGAKVRRYRSTLAFTPKHEFSSGVPFLPRNVDEDFKQNLYAVQEAVNETAGTAAEALAAAQAALDLVEARARYVNLGVYAAGLVFQTTSQVCSYDAGSGAEFYAPGPNLPLPYTTTGNPAELVNFRSVGDAILRQDLEDADGATLVGRGAGTVETALDALDADALAAKSPGFLKQQGDALHVLSGGTTGNTAAFDAALRTGTVRIAFAGDSIFEGLSQITYEDSPAGLFISALRAQSPDVNFIVGNFSLAGRGIGNLSSYAYVGIAGPDNPPVGFYQAPGNPAYGLWPEGSTIGKAWIYHVRDFAPDLFVVAMGMNEASGAGESIAALTKQVITESATWTKPPSVALVASMLPSIVNPPFPTAQVAVQIAADVMRSVAAETNSTLVDANREYLLLRDASDVVAKKHALDAGFANYPAGWTPISGAFTESGGTTLTGQGTTLLNAPAIDAHVTATFTAANYAVAVPAISYRTNLAVNSGNQYVAQVQAGNTAILYYNLTPIASSGITPLVNGQPVTLDVVSIGARHMVYVNRVLVIDHYDYQCLVAGNVALALSAAPGTITNYSARLGNPKAYGTPQLTETDLLGVYPNDWLTNPNSAGGSGTNHPSKLGALMAYGTAFRPLLVQAKNALAGGKVDVIYASSSDTTTAFDTPINQIIGVRIAGVQGPDGLAVGAVGNASAYADTYKRVAGGQTVVVDVVVSQVGYVLNTNLVLPKGFWDIKAVAQFARSGQGYRNRLSVVATRCS